MLYFNFTDLKLSTFTYFLPALSTDVHKVCKGPVVFVLCSNSDETCIMNSYVPDNCRQLALWSPCTPGLVLHFTQARILEVVHSDQHYSIKDVNSLLRIHITKNILNNQY